MKEWHFYDKVYRRWVVLMIGPYKDLVEELDSNGFKHMDTIHLAKGYTILLDDTNNTAGQRCLIVWMETFEAATLVHELSHLVMYVFDQIGIPISIDNTEGFAFYLEYWHTTMLRGRKHHPEGIPSTKVKR